jgi:hypothetical protein
MDIYSKYCGMVEHIDAVKVQNHRAREKDEAIVKYRAAASPKPLQHNSMKLRRGQFRCFG